MNLIKIGSKIIGDGNSVFVIAEAGINHNGSLVLAKKLIDIAKDAGCDAIKFQKRTPELCVPEGYKNIMRETPWGLMSYFDYKKKIEFEKKEYDIIDQYCRKKNILWSASAWDIPSIEFLSQYDLPFYKVPSALIVHKKYLMKLKSLKKPIFLSTGMSTMEIVCKAMQILGEKNTVLMHSTSIYPAKPEEINLRVIENYKKQFQCPVGYSGHEAGLQITLGAISIGADAIERHITINRTLWGTDQAASLEPIGLKRLVRDIKIIKKALGDGVKKIYFRERPMIKKLRNVSDIFDKNTTY